MFTGIIEGLGTIRQIRQTGKGRQIKIASDFELKDTGIGDSIAVNGACLTAINIDAKSFVADISPETFSITAFSKIKIGDRVNLERALRLSDRIDGHLVSGHIDCTGFLKEKKSDSNAVIMTFSADDKHIKQMIVKGSVAVDGVSLTINSIAKNAFTVSVIPHTADITSLGLKKIGDMVNIETDMIGKYVERFINNEKSGITIEKLAGAGFMSGL